MNHKSGVLPWQKEREEFVSPVMKSWPATGLPRATSEHSLDYSAALWSSIGGQSHLPREQGEITELKDTITRSETMFKEAMKKKSKD
ncbi:hypothetical protein E6H31_01325 [Candidatus Bathyarchaeota archaeon]|nr:MAG: hypothetical protein E6H31_01325 [Candidatus Bathyarchaeota archaeon]